MPRGGVRAGSGRPRTSQIKTMQRVAQELVESYDEFTKSLEAPYMRGLRDLVASYPGVIARMVNKACPVDVVSGEALPGDTDVQMFLVREVARIFQPEIVIAASASPMKELINRLHARIAADERANAVEGELVAVVADDRE